MSKIELSKWQDVEDGFPSEDYFDAVIVELEKAGVGVVESHRTELWEFVIELDHALAECAPWWDADEFRLVWRVNEESDPLHRSEDEQWHGFHAGGGYGPAGWHWLACMDGKVTIVTALDHPERRNTSMGPLADPADVAAAAAGLVREEPAAMQLQVDGMYEPVPSPVGRTCCPACLSLPIGHEGDCEP